jgi:hypothetical protein
VTRCADKFILDPLPQLTKGNINKIKCDVRNNPPLMKAPKRGPLDFSEDEIPEPHRENTGGESSDCDHKYVKVDSRKVNKEIWPSLNTEYLMLCEKCLDLKIISW